MAGPPHHHSYPQTKELEILASQPLLWAVNLLHWPKGKGDSVTVMPASVESTKDSVTEGQSAVHSDRTKDTTHGLDLCLFCNHPPIPYYKAMVTGFQLTALGYVPSPL